MHYRAIFASDVHMGQPETFAGLLAAWLRANTADWIILPGDIFDLWAMELRPEWFAENTDLVMAILEAAQTRVTYIPGNHDGVLALLVGKTVAGVEISAPFMYHSLKGRRYWVCHGHEFDAVVTAHAWASLLGTWAQDAMMWAIDPLVNFFRRRMGYKHGYSLAADIRRTIRTKAYMASFKTLLTRAAQAKGCDGVICGHIHLPAIELVEGIEYMNDGDVVASMTVLVENLDGTFGIVSLEAK
jgi:UDP-2,3-diacylglucosamine pyrophosphatase LpxH